MAGSRLAVPEEQSRFQGSIFGLAETKRCQRRRLAKTMHCFSQQIENLQLFDPGQMLIFPYLLMVGKSLR